jgi:hypothetical protein
MDRKLLLSVSVAASLISATAAQAVVIPGQVGGFGITPARRVVVGNPSLSLTPSTVLNNTNLTYAVQVFPILLNQSLSGAFTFDESKLSRNLSQLVLTASPTQFTLGPGQRRVVAVDWNLLPLGQKWVAVGVVFQGTPESQHGPLHVITRLLNINLLSEPGAGPIRGTFVGLFPEQFGKHVLRFLARVKNTGGGFGTPTDGRLTITNSSDQVVAAKPWTGDVIVPGAERDFPIDVTTQLPAGTYTATVTMNFGGHRSLSKSFRLVGPEQLPTPSIAVGAFNANATTGSPAQVTAVVRNTGSAPATVALQLFLGGPDAAPGTTALASGQVVFKKIAPGSTLHLSHLLGHGLPKGSYRAILTFTDPTGAPHMLEANFTTTPAKSFWSSLWGVLKYLLLALVILAVLAGVALLATRFRRRQQEMQAELAAARARMRAAGIEEDEREQAGVRD